MSVSFGGFNANTATFKVGSAIAAGTPVEMDGSGRVKNAEGRQGGHDQRQGIPRA